MFDPFFSFLNVQFVRTQLATQELSNTVCISSAKSALNLTFFDCKFKFYPYFIKNDGQTKKLSIMQGRAQDKKRVALV